MSWGSAIAIGLALGVALWVATDNLVFLSVGIVFAIIFAAPGAARSRRTSEPDNGTDRDDTA